MRAYRVAYAAAACADTHAASSKDANRTSSLVDIARAEREGAEAFVHDGIGALTVYGGHKLSSETWEPEHIELTPIAVCPGVAVKLARVTD